jgi:hypothetical protein
MTPTRLLALAIAGLSASACSYTETTTQPAPPVAVAPAATSTTVYTTGGPDQACQSYGFVPGTAAYSHCLSREAEARRYRQDTVVTTAGSRVTYVPAATTSPAGVEAFRDEYGYRYDGQGNRIDRQGNIISPHSTAP